ncbi:MAG: glycosyltransferase family 4 protein [Methylophilaceae bacterium]
MTSQRLRVLQVLPALDAGGVERGTLEVGNYLVENGHRSLVMSAGGRMVAQLEREGSEHIEWNIGQKSLLTLRYVHRLRRFFTEQKVDVVHVRSRLPGWIVYLAWRGMNPNTRPKFVTTVHGPYTVSKYSAVMTKGERVIVISEFIQRYILANYPDVAPDKIRLIYRGVSPKQFPYDYKPSTEWLDAWNKQYPQLKGKQVLTLPARLTRWKGQEDFIELIKRLRNRGLNVHGLLVGEAHSKRQDFKQELAQKAQKAGIAEHLTFVGHRSDLREIMANSKLVFSLSQEPEAFGRTTVEALSLGIPVIGYDHGGVGEQLAAILPQGRVPLGDMAALENLTLAWLETPPMVPREQPFTLRTMLERTLAVYQEFESDF